MRKLNSLSLARRFLSHYHPSHSIRSEGQHKKFFHLNLGTLAVYSKESGHRHDTSCSSVHRQENPEIEEEAPIIKLQKIQQEQTNTKSKPTPIDNIANKVIFDTVDISKITKEEFNVTMTNLREQLRAINPEQYSLALLQKDIDSVNICTILYCLNAEWATIKDHTKSQTTGSLRLAWWKDQLKNALVGHPPRVPALIALAYMQSHAKPENKLKFSHLRNIFKWREIDLRWKQPATLADIENYSDGVYGSLIMAHLQAVGKRNVHTDHVASHVGRSYGICTLLRAVPHLAEHSSTYLPAQLCAKFGVTEDDIYSKRASPALEEVVFKVADLAHSHLDLARELAVLKDEKSQQLLVDPKSYPLFMHSIICEVFLERLQKANFNIFDDRLSAQSMRFSILFKLGKTKWFGKY
ncbi:hypothetical protein C9374_003138 [Naegleria lovaniensis]|uniref:Phytoene synthase n=1 Tax=Naegleria lovaniensis TaxID=51637 RepID=A0AA88KLN3_NAELO|nr:uncharacterized protein C9374_003138 [Naegleria lovaniensis]KAG2385989.1 hypothetical protein C9374_003138 [Naegleria lovaniensis]